MDKDTLQEYGLVSGVNITKIIKLNDIKGIETARDMFHGVKDKNPEALRLYKEWFMILDKFVKLMANSYTPDIICMTGGLMKANDVFFEKLKEANPDVNIFECHFSKSACIMGASVYAY